MNLFTKPLLVAVALTAVVLAGCAESGGKGKPNDGAPPIDATPTTGGIRGVVVDEAIKPITGVNIEINADGDVKKLVTDDAGAFAISGLKPGQYLVKASHPFYNEGQQTAEVVAGQKDPPAVKIQLIRQIFAKPYMVTLKFDGFIVCSVNTVGFLSEECGEGVGVPRRTCDVAGGPCVDNPVLPGQRLGKTAGNKVQFDVPITEAGLAGIVFEKIWKPTSEAGTELYTPIGLDWRCDPFCHWTKITSGGKTVEMKGGSPQYFQIGQEAITKNKIEVGKNVTMFTWAGSFEDPAGVALNQAYQDYMSLSYYLPLPEGWSFVKGDKDPFK
jgi:hypothetical protein